MNLKKGMPCRIISCHETQIMGVANCFVTLTRIDDQPPPVWNKGNLPFWCFEEKLRSSPALYGRSMPVISLSHTVLRPLGNPGDGEVDEMVRLVGRPKGVTV